MTEPLDKIAQFAFDWAELLCDPSHECMPYHRSWAMLRLIEMGGALPAGEEFFRRGINNAAQNGKVHVLISGGADSGVMALAVESALREGIDIRVTAVDRCRTSLEQMRLYGATNGIKTDIIQCSLEQIPANLNVDAILGHTVLPFIPINLRPKVFKSWFETLRPGGYILLSQRLSLVEGNFVSSVSDEDIIDRKKLLEQKIKSYIGKNIRINCEEIIEAAEVLWKTNLTRVSLSVDQLREYATNASLDVKEITERNGGENVSPLGMGHSLRGNRYEIILEKNNV